MMKDEKENTNQKNNSLTESQFHTVWTEAVGRNGYNKELFREVLIALKDKNLINNLIKSPNIEKNIMKKEKLQKLLNNFYKVCSLCEELDIYEHETLDSSLQEMKKWVNENFNKTK